MPRTLAILTAVAAVAAAPAVASANPRYASPTNQGTGDCMSEANSCILRTAILNAGSGDDVYVRADLGDYSPGSGIVTPSGVPIHIHGLHGRPRILFNNGGLGLQDGTAENLYVENQSGAATAFGVRSGASADRVIAKAGGNGNACGMDHAKLTNSVCWAGSTGTAGVDADGSNTLRNDTVIGGTNAAMMLFGRECVGSCPETDTYTLVNVIARSGSSAPDISACSDGTAIAQVNVSHSNYATTTTAVAGFGCVAAMGHVTSDGTNQTAAPVFANAGIGNFHEKPGSPTIDKGIKASANGTKDFEGDPRFLGAGTDIGADEARSPSITITRPADGAHYKLGQNVTASFKCLDPDGPADIALCKGTVASGLPIDTATAGKHSFTVQARDKAGFKTAKSVHYTVDTAEKTPPVVQGLPGDQRCVPKGLKLKVSVHPTRLKQALVFLDGKQIAVSTKPRFTVTLKASQLKPGRHKVMIERDYKSGTRRRSTFSFSSCKGGSRSPHIRTQGTPDRGSCTAKAFKMIVTITGAVPSSIAVKLDGKSLPKPGKAQFTLTINVPALARGVHHVTISAADKFKNGSVDVTDFVRC